MEESDISVDVVVVKRGRQVIPLDIRVVLCGVHSSHYPPATGTVQYICSVLHCTCVCT